MVTKEPSLETHLNPRDSAELSTGRTQQSELQPSFSQSPFSGFGALRAHEFIVVARLIESMQCSISRASSRSRRELRCAPSHHATPRPDAQASCPMSSPSFTVTRHHPQKHHQCAKAGEPDGNHLGPFGRGGWDINIRMFNNTSRGWDAETNPNIYRAVALSIFTKDAENHASRSKSYESNSGYVSD